MPKSLVPGSRMKAIREKCTDCAGGIKDRQNCEFRDCALWPLRNAHRPKDGTPYDPPLKAIREYCKWCCSVEENRKGGTYMEALNCIYECPCTDCAIWPYRPRRAGQSAESCEDLPEETAEEDGEE